MKPRCNIEYLQRGFIILYKIHLRFLPTDRAELHEQETQEG